MAKNTYHFVTRRSTTTVAAQDSSPQHPHCLTDLVPEFYTIPPPTCLAPGVTDIFGITVTFLPGPYGSSYSGPLVNMRFYSVLLHALLLGTLLSRAASASSHRTRHSPLFWRVLQAGRLRSGHLFHCYLHGRFCRHLRHGMTACWRAAGARATRPLRCHLPPYLMTFHYQALDF